MGNKMNKKIVTFGEILLRLTPPGCLKFSQTDTVCATFGGSETNCAVSLAHLGLKSEFVTRVPDNDIVRSCIMDLRSHGVLTSHVVYGGERLGLYYFENTSSARAAKVVYDRSNSSFCTMTPSAIDWENVFQDADWFHWSGIGPSLSMTAAETTMAALNIAEQKGLTISCDLNYRKNLWQYGKSPEEIMPALVSKCDVLFGTEGEYNKAFGVKPVGFTATTADAQIDMDAHLAFCREVMAKAPKCKYMFIALRNVINANKHVLTGLLYTVEGQLYTTRIHLIEHVVDCVGVGDAFVAGIIYALKNFSTDCQKVLDFAVAASTLKNSIVGDYNIVTAEEVLRLAQGDSSGRISR
jgi:2-dehydro-3-deoxygluconokinase